MTADQHHRSRSHGHVHLGEADWAASVARTELEGEVLLDFVSRTAAWLVALRRPDAPPVRRILDIGSGPGVGTCELAEWFPTAHVTAVDGSPAMLGRARRRAAAHGLAGRIDTQLADLPDGLTGMPPADVIWASMALHHLGDEVASLRMLGGLLAPHGLLAVAERADPMRVLPDDLGLGRRGLVDRLDDANAQWFTAMREGLTDSVRSSDLPSMLAAAGLEVVGDRVDRQHLAPPLAHDARRVVLGHLQRTRDQLVGRLDDDDLRTLDVLLDAEDSRSVLRRPDVFLSASRQIVIARTPGG